MAEMISVKTDISQIPKIAYILNSFGNACNKALSSNDVIR